MKKNLLSFVTLALVSVGLFFMSCGDSGKKAADDVIDESEIIEEEIIEEVTTMDFSAGEALYVEKCAVCHQVNGEGLAGSFPPLAKADYLLADVKRAYTQIGNGSATPITVNGVEYPGGVMTPVELTEEQTLDVLNYVLNSWGNEHGMVKMEDIK